MRIRILVDVYLINLSLALMGTMCTLTSMRRSLSETFEKQYVIFKLEVIASKMTR